MTKTAPTVNDRHQSLHRALAQFRHQLRIFLLASEEASLRAGLHPQQHQLLLAVAGAQSESQHSIAYAAEQLGLKHNTVVELVDRCEQEDLLHRTVDREDRRRVCLKISARGQQVLDGLSQVHLEELHSQAPHLILSLQNVLQNESKRQGKRLSKRNG